MLLYVDKKRFESEPFKEVNFAAFYIANLPDIGIVNDIQKNKRLIYLFSIQYPVLTDTYKNSIISYKQLTREFTRIEEGQNGV